jgi:HSP90 family molecular chaperone
MKSLVFIPPFHTEKFAAARMEPGVSIYCRNVLIEQKPKDLLPDWLRFVKGVVDSEDLPLSISREKPQDSALLRRIGNTITRKVLRHLDDVSKKDKEAYNVFWAEYSRFIKEGVCQDPTFQAQAAKLLRFESSKLNQGEITSLDEYIARCSEEQQEIYYLMAPTRELAEQSPYYEAFKANNTEVLFLYNTLDDFTMDALKSYNGRRLVGADSNSVDLKASKKSKKSKKGEENKEGEDSNKEEEEEEEEESGSSLTTAQATDLCTWIKSTLGDKLVKEVGVTERLASTPAMITDHENGSLRRMMKFLEQQNAGQAPFLPQQHLDINPSHPIIVGLFALKESNPAIAAVIARQVYDNAMVNAGMMDDGREMVPRINQLMEALIGK